MTTQQKSITVRSGRQDDIDFKVFSDPLEAGEDIVALAKGQSDIPRRPMVRGIGSSNCVDLAGDIITENALNDIVNKMGVNTAISFNHSYNVPEDIFGGLAQRPALVRMKSSHHGLLRPDAEFAAVELVAHVNRALPRAMIAYKTMAEEGIQLGFSIGFNITDYEMIKDISGAPTGFRVEHLDPLEESIVQIPCNQQSWVTAAGEYIQTKDFNLDMIQKGLVSYVTPPFETTDTNWAAAASRGLFKRFGIKTKWNSEAEFVYAAKHFRDFDEVTAAWLYQQNEVYKRWGLCLAYLPEEN